MSVETSQNFNINDIYEYLYIMSENKNAIGVPVFFLMRHSDKKNRNNVTW